MLCNLSGPTIITVEKVFAIMTFCLSLWYGENVSECLIIFKKYLKPLESLFKLTIPVILKFVIFIFIFHILTAAIKFSYESQLAVFIFLHHTIRSLIAFFYYRFKTHSEYYLIYLSRLGLFPSRIFIHLCSRAFSFMKI